MELLKLILFGTAYSYLSSSYFIIFILLYKKKIIKLKIHIIISFIKLFLLYISLTILLFIILYFTIIYLEGWI